MNCTELFFSHVRQSPRAPALWLPGSGTTTFGDLADIATRAQRLFRRHGVGTGDRILLVEGLGPNLYGLVVGALAMGATVLLVEPWMPVHQIDRVVRAAHPKLLVGGSLGLAWGLRVPAIRAIPSWQHTKLLHLESSAERATVEDVPADLQGVITFTSGTTGNPKGVVRGQGYLLNQYEVLVDSLDMHDATGADLCIFANFVLVNLAQGRPSVVIPPGWKRKHFKQIDALPHELQPATMSCGPGFLIEALKYAKLRHLRDAHVGGALTDAWIFEAALDKWPAARWTHIYGSSEAEPVAIIDAREAVHRSRQRGLFQVLSVGEPVPAIEPAIETDTVWITGPHVCPMYLGNDRENELHKRKDEQGRVWHDMGDRITVDEQGWWYSGRSGQSPEQFALEQRIYAAMGSSKSFVHATQSGELVLVGQHLQERRAMLSLRFPELGRLVEAPIQRDRRHRARIDRKATLEKGAPELLTWSENNHSTNTRE